MTKLSVARVFEVSLIAASRSYGELQTFVEYVNSLADNLIRIMQNGVGIRDNLDAEIKTITLQHGRPTAVAFRKRPVVVHLSAMSGSQLNPVTALFAVPGDGAQADLTAYYLAGSDVSQAVTVTAYFS